MRHAWLLAVTLSVAPAVLLAQSEPVRQSAPADAASNPQPAARPKPLPTNRRSFFIPVTVDRSSREHVPAEVHLLVSADQGKTWSTYARQTPDSKGFQFQGRDDGEYWFASRTLDAQGRAKPAGDVEPELRIVIDSTQPKIELDTAVGASGEAKAAWRISDPNIAFESVRVEYQSGDALRPSWQTVSVDAADQKLVSGMLIGSAAWSPQTTSRAIDVRIIAHDRAGNVATDTRRVFLPRESRVATPRIPEWPPRVAPQTNDTSSPSIAGDPFTSRQFPAGETSNETATPSRAQPGSSSPAATTWPADNKLPASWPNAPSANDKLASKPSTLPTEPLARLPSTVSPPVTDRVVARPSSTGGANSPLIWPGGADRHPESPAMPSMSATAPRTLPPPLESIPQPSTPPGNSAWSGDIIDPMAGADRPQLTSSKSFSLDYDVDSVGPSGVRAVELWVTVDGGRTWEKWGEDEDRRSPFEIQVESERLFGFRMVIVANNGLATRSPEPGDAADIWIAIDGTKPRARLLQASYGQGEHAGQLDIRWEADDEHLGPRPISISFGETADGPFTMLAASLPNSGQYFWTIDPRTPRQLFLRLEVRDDAGNVAMDQTPEQVSLEGLSPKGRIRAISPGSAPQAPVHGAFRSPLFR